MKTANLLDYLLNKELSSRHSKLILILLILVGGVLRFFNLYWDGGYEGHPDEANFAEAALKINFPRQLDPGFYSYGTFLIYAMRAVSEVLHIITGNSDWITERSAISLSGRIVTAFLSTLSIYLFYILVKKLTEKEKYALLAAAISTFNVGFIQYSKYAVSDIPLLTALLLICITSINVIRQNTFKDWLKVGAACGFALAIKMTALSFFIIPFVSWLIIIFRTKEYFRMIKTGFLFIIITLFTFFIISPYYVINYKGALKAIDLESGIATGRYPRGFTEQFTNTLPYFYYFKTIPWHIGLIPTILGLVGILLYLYLLIKKKSTLIYLPIITFGIVYFLYVGRWHTKFIRYMLPLYIVIIIGFIFAIQTIHQKLKYKNFAKLISISALLLNITWSFAFMSVYVGTNTRIEASRWILQNVPKGSSILTEGWDYELPIKFKNEPPQQYYKISMDNFKEETEEKLIGMSFNISDSDYIIIASRRVYKTIMNNTRYKFPYTANYYDMLFDGQLGFELIKTFESYPRIGPFIIRDDEVPEETFSVYDHPKIMIFKKTKKMSNDQIYALIKKA